MPLLASPNECGHHVIKVNKIDGLRAAGRMQRSGETVLLSHLLQVPGSGYNLRDLSKNFAAFAY